MTLAAHLSALPYSGRLTLTGVRPEPMVCFRPVPVRAPANLWLAHHLMAQVQAGLYLSSGPAAHPAA